jgi:hypothetical protein
MDNYSPKIWVDKYEEVKYKLKPLPKIDKYFKK